MAFNEDVTTEPQKRVMFNGPFASTQKTYMLVKNQSRQKTIAWMLKSTNKDRFIVKPTSGIIKPEKDVLLDISCEPFDYTKDQPADRLSLVWVEISADQEPSKGMFNNPNHKKIKIRYNY